VKTPTVSTEAPGGAPPVRLHGFALISGIGWLIDFGLFTLLAYGGVDLFLANLAGAATAVTFVFVAARRFIFRDLKRPLASAVTAYVLWNLFAVLLASIAVDRVADLLSSSRLVGDVIESLSAGWATAGRIVPPLAKILVTPATMYANYVAMGVITERRFSFI
jgi:putative flippase GtrA